MDQVRQNDRAKAVIGIMLTEVQTEVVTNPRQ